MSSLQELFQAALSEADFDAQLRSENLAGRISIDADGLRILTTETTNEAQSRSGGNYSYWTRFDFLKGDNPASSGVRVSYHWSAEFDRGVWLRPDEFFPFGAA